MHSNFYQKNNSTARSRLAIVYFVSTGRESSLDLPLPSARLKYIMIELYNSSCIHPRVKFRLKTFKRTDSYTLTSRIATIKNGDAKELHLFDLSAIWIDIANTSSASKGT